jgi:hypothetical protein
MGWKTINGRRYYCKSEREGSRVKTIYFGAGESGLLILLLEQQDRDEREAKRNNDGPREREEFATEEKAVADPEFIAALNRAKSFRRDRLRAEGRSLASDAMATFRDLVSGPDIPPSVRLRASLAILQAADTMNVEQIGPTSAEGVVAELEHKRFLESLGGSS